MKKYGKIDILINNAGILETGLKPIDRFLDEDLDRIVETNQKGTMRCMRAAARRMQSGASIVNVASVAGVKGCGGAAYVASKAAVIGVTDEQGLTKTKSYVVCKPGQTTTEDELKAFVKSRLAAYKYPRLIEFVDELPKTATGKIQRFRLRELDSKQS